MDSILQLDADVFVWLHQNLKTGLGDVLMPYITNKLTWIPLYVAILVYIGIRQGKKVLPFLLACLLCVGIADTVSSRIIKKNVKRARPCNTETLQPEITLLTYCGSGYSFTSSHATNHFAIASFWFFALVLVDRRMRWIFFLWAALIAYSRVYIGVHFPLDILAGSLLGFLIGRFVYFLYQKLPKDWVLAPIEKPQLV